MAVGQHARRSARGRDLAATGATAALVIGGVVALVLGLGSSPRSEPPLSTSEKPAPRSAPERALVRVGPTPVTATVAEPPAGPVLSASTPLRLAIPSIGVDSVLLQLGQEADGTLEVPPPGPQYDLAGWYQHSPTPGELGPSVIAGHVDSAAAGPSVFFRLADLAPGDEVLVDRADGSTAVFRVDDVRRYGKTDFPTAGVYGDTDHAALRLITCGGSFDRASGHYVDNVVVTATLTGSRGSRDG